MAERLVDVLHMQSELLLYYPSRITRSAAKIMCPQEDAEYEEESIEGPAPAYRAAGAPTADLEGPDYQDACQSGGRALEPVWGMIETSRALTQGRAWTGCSTRRAYVLWVAGGLPRVRVGADE